MDRRRSPRNLRIAWNHRGRTHYGGIYFLHELFQVLQCRRLASWHWDYPRRNQRYSLPQMLLALITPIILGLDRLEPAAFLRNNGPFQYLTGLGSYPDPQSLRRFLLQAPRSSESNCTGSMTACCGNSSINPNTGRG